MTRYADLIAWFGSSIVAQVAPSSVTNWRARSTGSSVRTPTTTRPSAACCSSFAFSSGNSVRHGTQLGPQKLTTTGWPRSCSRRNGVPSSVVPAISGAGLPFWMGPAPDVAGFTAWTSTTIATVAMTAISSAIRMGRRDRGPAVVAGDSATSGSRDELAVHQGGMNRALELVRAGLQLGDVVDLRRDAREVLVVDDLLAA